MRRVYILEVKKLIIVFLLIVLSVISVLLVKHNNEVIYIDKDYLYALNTADKYLYAWVMRDGLIAYDLISDNIKRNYNGLKDFQMHFAGASNPHHQAFEIVGYRYLSKDRICFKVWYYEDYTGIYLQPVMKGSPSFLELIKVDKEKWLIDIYINRDAY